MNQQPPKCQTINLLDFFTIFIKWRWMIIRNTFITILVIVVISLILPQKFTAVTTLMPPQEQTSNALEGVLSEVVVPGLPLPSNRSSSEIMVEILKSRSVGERVLEASFKQEETEKPLYEILKYDSVQQGLLKIRKHVRFSSMQNGIITVSAEMGDRQLAADVANAYVNALDKINQEKSVSRAKNSRIYIESQLKETETKLKEATQKLADFQQQHKAVSLEAQMTAALEQAGVLKGQIIAKEVELGVMMKTMKKGNPLAVRIQMEINELNNRYRELQFGNGAETNATSEFYVPFADVPEIGLQLAELTREVQVQETVWQLLNQQFYQAKIKEAQDTPTVQVLDAAVPPLKKSSPKRGLLVIIFAMLAFVTSLLWVFSKEYLATLENKPADKERIDYIGKQLKNDLGQIKKRFGK